MTPGDTLTYDWDYGDGTSDGTAAAESHTYTGTSPVGGWTAVGTVTATGDGTDDAGTTTATCSEVVSAVGTGTGVGGGGGTTPGAPTSCSWTDFLCDIEAAVAWLVVPPSGFYASWDSFVGQMETHVPFSYVAEAVTWTDGFIAQVNETTTLLKWTVPVESENFGEPVGGGGFSTGRSARGRRRMERLGRISITGCGYSRDLIGRINDSWHCRDHLG